MVRSAGDMLDLEAVDDDCGEGGPHKQDRLEEKSRKGVQRLCIKSRARHQSRNREEEQEHALRRQQARCPSQRRCGRARSADLEAHHREAAR